MESVATQVTTWWPRSLRRVDGLVAATWVLAIGLVLYLGLEGGGYDIVVSSQIGILLWWTLLICAAWGVLPPGRLPRLAWAALASFGLFVAWTALASTWSISSEQSLQELSRVATYLAVLLLALAIHRDRERAVRHTVNAIAVTIVIIAALALTSRLVPDAFPASHVTAAFLGGSQSRLGWPLNYWNGLAALVALGLPLLLSAATSARTLWFQAAAAAALPVLALCAYLTFSRGGAVAMAIAALAFLALAPDRVPKLATMLAAAGGSAVLIVAALHRPAIEHGLTDHAAFVQGRQLFVAILLVCAAVGLAQIGIGLAARHGTAPGLLRPSRRRAQMLLGAGLVVLLVTALAAGVPSDLSHAWHEFKTNENAAPPSNLPGRYGSLSGDDRYAYWKVALDATSGKRLTGSGPGTFQLLWQPRAPFFSYVVNAHSLYIETLAEDGLIGLALLAGFFVLVLVAAVRLVIRTKHEERARAAAAAAALLAFMVSAAVDWVWQLPVLPAAFLLLAAAVLAPASPITNVRILASRSLETIDPADGRRRRVALRVGLVGLAAACLVGIGIPLAATNDVRASQSAAADGDTTAALADARSAVRVEPGAASPELQLSLVLELQRDYPGAISAALKATRDEPQNWSSWLVLSRLEAEAGHAKASVIYYRRARSLNPRSPLFQT